MMKNLINNSLNFIQYLLSKKSEINKLGYRDVLLGKVTLLDIRMEKVKTKFVKVPLYSIDLLHPIDRVNAITATIDRAKIIEKEKNKILNLKIIDRELMGNLLPSVSCIKVIEENTNSYICFDGNGRIQAIKRVFGEEDHIMVEVELYVINNTEKILLTIGKIRRLWNRE